MIKISSLKSYLQFNYSKLEVISVVLLLPVALYFFITACESEYSQNSAQNEKILLELLDNKHNTLNQEKLIVISNDTNTKPSIKPDTKLNKEKYLVIDRKQIKGNNKVK